MKKLWKRNGVVAAVVLFVCVAAYLNWSYTGSGEAVSTDAQVEDALQEESSSLRTLGEAVLVNSTVGGARETGAADNAAYFDAARLSREQARDSALSMLQETVNNTSADQSAVQSAAEAITAMAEATLMESEIESLVAAKGYQDCVTYIGTDSVSVVVDGGLTGLEASDVAVITDIVISETGYDASQIKVVDTTAETTP